MPFILPYHFQHSPGEEHHHEPRASHGIGEQFVLNDPEGRVFDHAKEVEDAAGHAQHDQQVGHEEDGFGGVGCLTKGEDTEVIVMVVVKVVTVEFW